jgi:alkylation response protein AidB-like acyl-CoA dehydrogenase
VELTSEQRALRESVADVLRRHPPVLDPEADGARDRDAELWRSLSEIGVGGLAIAEQFDGAGAGPVEISVVAEQLGRALAPSPLLGSAVLAAQVILGSGDPSARNAYLPKISNGGLIASLAWTDSEGAWDPARAACYATARSGGRWTLTGAAHYVLDADLADVLIVAATMPDDSIGLFAVTPGQSGVSIEPSPAMDQTRRMAVVRLAAAADEPIASGDDASRALAHAKDLACIALSAEQVGATARALELTTGYAKTRIQFGRPIASFQAIQFRLAELYALVESARELSYRAASAAARPEGQDGSELPLLAAAAKSYCSEVLSKVAAEMIQLHGAIGVTWEYDAHRYFKRAHGAGQLFGSPSAHLARIAEAVLDR